MEVAREIAQEAFKLIAEELEALLDKADKAYDEHYGDEATAESRAIFRTGWILGYAMRLREE